ncbi:hypothetical protein AHF37_11460 [Paragonimus kellicotti]|nr:hypothetical protein AHF37_11460 [Paragonimus kellicotti]
MYCRVKELSIGSSHRFKDPELTREVHGCRSGILTHHTSRHLYSLLGMYHSGDPVLNIKASPYRSPKFNTVKLILKRSCKFRWSSGLKLIVVIVKFGLRVHTRSQRWAGVQSF